MNEDASFNDTARTGELVLWLTEIARLFNAPRIDPSSRRPAEVLGVSGVAMVIQVICLAFSSLFTSDLTQKPHSP